MSPAPSPAAPPSTPPLGRWECSGDTPPPTGSRPHIIFRPEAIRPAVAGASGNRFDATVIAVRPQGATLAVTLQAGSHTLRATLLNDPTLALGPGQTSGWIVPVANTIVVPE